MKCEISKGFKSQFILKVAWHQNHIEATETNCAEEDEEELKKKSPATV